jgi:LAO/AO transport system kinase
VNSFSQKYNPEWNSNIELLAKNLAEGNKTALSKAITLVESNKKEDFEKVQLLLKTISELPKKNAYRIGITGTPGVGKSTFIETYGHFLTQNNHQVAVLAIDPTSSKSGGSIMGDKTRMNELSRNENVFIRPTPSGSDLGGVAARTMEVIQLCEAAGFDRIIVETVGVGQSEYRVAEMTDLFILLTLPNSGDELQGIKRGIMEMADLIIINKADGDNISKAKIAQKQIENAIQLMPEKENGCIVKTLLCSALENSGIQEAYLAIEELLENLNQSGYLSSNRNLQLTQSFKRLIEEKTLDYIRQNENYQSLLSLLNNNLINGGTSPYRELQKYLYKIENLKTFDF